MKTFFTILLSALPLAVSALDVNCDDVCNASCIQSFPEGCICANDVAIRCNQLCGRALDTTKMSKCPVPPKAQCGSRGLPRCEEGLTCTRIPGATCGPEADCGGICVRNTKPVPTVPSKPVWPTFTWPPRPAPTKPAPAPETPNIPDTTTCGPRKVCPADQECSHNECVASRCSLRPQAEKDKVRCPAGQKCYQQAFRSGTIIFDIAGTCASEKDYCTSDNQCPRNWTCQKKPNGEFVTCKEGDDCGLCVPYSKELRSNIPPS